MNKIGKCIKYLRKQQNLKQEQLAKIIGIERTTLSGYETERREISFRTMEIIANECGYDIVFINKNKKEMFKIKDIIRKDI